MDSDSRSPAKSSTPTLRPTTERPVYKLSVGLLSTYKQINDLFYEAKRKRHANRKPAASALTGHDDDQGNYVAQVGEEIAERYVVQETLGKGSFGVVVKAYDRKRSEPVAVKIIKNKLQFYQQAKIETEILTRLNTTCSEEHNIVKLKKVFTWKDHLCLVFELLSFNLYDLLKYTKFGGISLNLIRKFAFQILKTLEFLASPEIGVVHCDLKPENVLLKNPKRSGIKVIDFGSSCFGDKKMFKYIQSRFYRAPEVIMGLHYDYAIDMWSLGAILVEMHTGQPVFDGKDEADQLLKMACVLGAPPQRLIEQSPKRRNFFQWDAKLKRWILAPPDKDLSRYKSSTLEEIVGVYTGGPGGRRRGQPGHAETDYIQFLDLIKKMFVYPAPLRITPVEALRHPFLSSLVSETSGGPNAAPRMREDRGRMDDDLRGYAASGAADASCMLRNVHLGDEPSEDATSAAMPPYRRGAAMDPIAAAAGGPPPVSMSEPRAAAVGTSAVSSAGINRHRSYSGYTSYGAAHPPAAAADSESHIGSTPGLTPSYASMSPAVSSGLSHTQSLPSFSIKDHHSTTTRTTESQDCSKSGPTRSQYSTSPSMRLKPKHPGVNAALGDSPAATSKPSVAASGGGYSSGAYGYLDKPVSSATAARYGVRPHSPTSAPPAADIGHLRKGPTAAWLEEPSLSRNPSKPSMDAVAETSMYGRRKSEGGLKSASAVREPELFDAKYSTASAAAQRAQPHLFGWKFSPGTGSDAAVWDRATTYGSEPAMHMLS